MSDGSDYDDDDFDSFSYGGDSWDGGGEGGGAEGHDPKYPLMTQELLIPVAAMATGALAGALTGAAGGKCKFASVIGASLCDTVQCIY